MDAEKCKHWAELANRMLLGLLVLVPGLMKLFVMGPSGVAAFLGGLGFPVASVFAWILIIAEIGSGLAILARWHLKWATIPPIVILIVAAFSVYLSSATIPAFIMHLAAASNYAMLGAWHCHEEAH